MPKRTLRMLIAHSLVKIRLRLRLVKTVKTVICFYLKKKTWCKRNIHQLSISIRLANVAIFVCDRTVLPNSDTSSSILVCCYGGICDWRTRKGWSGCFLKRCIWSKSWLISPLESASVSLCSNPTVLEALLYHQSCHELVCIKVINRCKIWVCYSTKKVNQFLKTLRILIHSRMINNCMP